MYFMCSYAGFRCLIEACEEAINDIKRFKDEYGSYYQFEYLTVSNADYDISIKVIKQSNSISKNAYENFNKIRIHSSHSKNIKYLLDGSIHTQKKAEQYAFVNDCDDIVDFFLEGSYTLVKVNKKERHIDIIGDNVYNDLVYVYESLFNSFVEYKGGIALHAASCSINGKGIIVCGESGSGKTTLLFDLIFKFGAKFHSNDRLVVFNDLNNSKLLSYGVPIPVNVPIKTMRNLDDWKNVDVVKNAEPDTKIRFKVNEIPLLFSNKIESYITIDYILSVKYDSTKPKVERISAKEVVNEIELLTPYDECHPKWLPVFLNDNINKDEVENTFLNWLNKVEVLRVSGNSLISAFEQVLPIIQQ